MKSFLLVGLEEGGTGCGDRGRRGGENVDIYKIGKLKRRTNWKKMEEWVTRGRKEKGCEREREREHGGSCARSLSPQPLPFSGHQIFAHLFIVHLSFDTSPRRLPTAAEGAAAEAPRAFSSCQAHE